MHLLLLLPTGHGPRLKMPSSFDHACASRSEKGFIKFKCYLLLTREAFSTSAIQSDSPASFPLQHQL